MDLLIQWLSPLVWQVGTLAVLYLTIYVILKAEREKTDVWIEKCDEATLKLNASLKEQIRLKDKNVELTKRNEVLRAELWEVGNELEEMKMREYLNEQRTSNEKSQ